ncbi:hypothetical protein NC651_034662 [Populus alba x Populus x berolinensis]|nr:hypothetical protein NC651_034662 [Populus alba x Populus x berolinensis]
MKGRGWSWSRLHLGQSSHGAAKNGSQTKPASVYNKSSSHDPGRTWSTQQRRMIAFCRSWMSRNQKEDLSGHDSIYSPRLNRKPGE